MSVLLNYAMFPMDKNESVSEYVSLILDYLKTSDIKYKLNSMGTTIETNTMSEALTVIQKSYDILDAYSNRIYCTINIDARKEKDNRLEGKIDSIENRIGSVNH